jgi:hypothetical protein
MRRHLFALAAVSLVAGFLTTPSASAQQSVNFFLGGFVPTSADARGDVSGGTTNDVLVKDQNFLTFRTDRFKGATVGGEYLVALGDFFEAGAGIGYYQKTVAAFDTGHTNLATGGNISADLKLRIVPFTATFRFLPLGHHSGLEPYIGGGIGVFGYHYSESGQFVDYTPPIPRNPAIFNQTFSGSGTATGPVVVGGVRVPVGPLAPGFEMRWQSAKGNLSTDPTTGFNSPKIDLGGISYLFTFAIRF